MDFGTIKFKLEDDAIDVHSPQLPMRFSAAFSFEAPIMNTYDHQTQLFQRAVHFIHYDLSMSCNINQYISKSKVLLMTGWFRLRFNDVSEWQAPF